MVDPKGNIRVLVVGHDPQAVGLLRLHLEEAGFAVLEAADAAMARKLVGDGRPDVLLLEMSSPEVDGIAVCRAVKGDRATSRLPVLLMDSRTDESSRVAGLEAGADDYVVKPSVRELILRIQRLVARKPADGSSIRQLCYGDVVVDVARHRVWVGGAELELTPLEFRLLASLVQNAEIVNSREQLLEETWEGRRRFDSRTVDTHIMRLREKLGAAGRCIQTVRGYGYRFVRP